MDNYAIAFKNESTGSISYYTGKAGGDYLSPKKEDAFFAYSLEGVNYRGLKMLQSPALKGYSVVAVPQDELAKGMAVKSDALGPIGKAYINPARDLPFMTVVAGHVLIHEPDNGTPLPDDWTGLCVDGNDVHGFWYIGRDNGERSFSKLAAREHAEAEIEAAERFKAEHGEYENNYRIKKGRELLEANGFRPGLSVDWSKQLEGWETVTVYSPKLDTQHGEWEFAIRGHSSAAVKRGVIVDDRRLSIARFMDKLLAAYPGMASQKGAKLCYGVLKDCTPESLSFLTSFDGVVVGQVDVENKRFRHVKLTAEALDRVREFPADFVFEVLAEANPSEAWADPSAMSVDALAAEAAHLGWTLHAPEEETPTRASREAMERRRTAVVAEFLGRAKEAAKSISPSRAPAAEVETPTI